MIAAERVSDFNLTTEAPHLTLMGKLWGVCYVYFGENWLRYSGTALYSFISKQGAASASYMYIFIL